MKIELNVSQKLVLTPQLRTAIEILHMSALELNQKIQNELQDNPFLEEDPVQEDTPDEEKFEQPVKTEEPTSTENYFEDSSDTGFVRKSNSFTANDNFIEGVLSRPDSLKEHLMWQLRLSVSESRKFAIGEMIIGNINDDGFLTVPLSELTNDKVTLKEIEEVLVTVQTFEPYGIAARNLQESLLNQLRYSTKKDQWAERILHNHFDLLSSRKWSQIAKNLGVSEKIITHSIDFISTLNPRPGREYENTVKSTVYVIPDVIVKRLGSKFVVIVNDPWMPRLGINNYYDSLLKNYSGKDTTLKFLEEKYISALWLLKSIEQRRLTITKVVNSILKYQKGFFEKGIKFISPLTLRVIADHIKMHESTISRVTRGKYIQTPWGIFELKYFFSSKLKSDVGEDFSSRSVKEILKDLIENETSAFSDIALVDKLHDIGVNISRRTVTKYRKNLNILPSYLRKK
jgi:RNA polymerase sigma-54 factor